MFGNLPTPTSIRALFFFYVYRFQAFKFPHFGGENKIFALSVGLWTIRNTVV